QCFSPFTTVASDSHFPRSFSISFLAASSLGGAAATSRLTVARTRACILIVYLVKATSFDLKPRTRQRELLSKQSPRKFRSTETQAAPGLEDGKGAFEPVSRAASKRLARRREGRRLALDEGGKCHCSFAKTAMFLCMEIFCSSYTDKYVLCI